MAKPLTYKFFTGDIILPQNAEMRLSNGKHIIKYETAEEFFNAANILLDEAKTLTFIKNGKAIFTWNPEKDMGITENILRGKEIALFRRRTNVIKSKMFDLLKNEKSNIKTLLSIGTGKGGDIFKWQRLGIEKLVIVEPNRDNILILKERLENTKFSYIILNMGGQETEKIMQKTEEFLKGRPDVVEFMLSLSFFNFQNKKQFENLVKLAKFGKYVIFLTIDGKKTKMLLSKNPKFSLMSLELRKNDKKDKISFTENVAPTRVTEYIRINIPNSLVENQDEYLVNTDLLVKAIDGDVIAKGSVLGEKLLTKDEKLLSMIYVFYIIKNH